MTTAEKKPKPSRPGIPNQISPSAWWSKLELDTRTMLMMLKGALAPTIAIAIHVS
ncbi:hypothetical protein PENANT_c002G11467 [Penicillium antarcticum]|uniref:Uncharacterized protein n=1 Tax=Penicillium antarcticum TaxID=416450 RepID=A0A1V6QJL8_9EURO|nr:hypothetical protein PENANT_c002G11467 [Penicillium antarcticum]